MVESGDGYFSYLSDAVLQMNTTRYREIYLAIINWHYEDNKYWWGEDDWRNQKNIDGQRRFRLRKPLQKAFRHPQQPLLAAVEWRHWVRSGHVTQHDRLSKTELQSTLEGGRRRDGKGRTNLWMLVPESIYIMSLAWVHVTGCVSSDRMLFSLLLTRVTNNRNFLCSDLTF